MVGLIAEAGFNLTPNRFATFNCLSVGMEGLEPSRLTALDPKSSADTNFATSRKKHPNDFRSHICRNPDGFIAPSAVRTKFLIYFLYAFISPHFVKLFYSIPPT